MVEDPSSIAGLRANAARLKAKSELPDAANTVGLLGDAAMIVVGLFLGFWLRFRSGWVPMSIPWWSTVPPVAFTPITDYFRLFVLGTVLLLITFAINGVYDPQNLLRFQRTYGRILRALIFWFFAYLGMSLALNFTPPISRIYVLTSWLSCGITLLGWRWCFHRLMQRESIAQDLRQHVIFMGWSPEASRLFAAIASDPRQPYRLIGCLPAVGSTFTVSPPAAAPRLGNAADLAPLLATGVVDIVILAEGETGTDEVLALADLCEREHVQFKVIAGYFQILASGLQLETISGVPIMGVSQLPLDRIVNRVLKRLLDLFGAVIGLILCGPIFLIFGTLILLESPGNIFYCQTRVGRNGRHFRIIKLRSMRLNAEATGGAQWAKKNDPRRLRIGAFLREWNLDEVPQFWNVLLGDMSLVGPRPERPELIADFKHSIPHYNARHACKPGMTGWAQVHGLRGDTDLAERVRYDLWYLENWSVWLDFQIMLMTFIHRKNAY